MKYKQIKTTADTHAIATELAQKMNMPIGDVVELALRKLQAERSFASEAKPKELTTPQKLRVIWDAIKAYNLSEKGKQEPKYITFRSTAGRTKGQLSAYYLNTQTGYNRSRDIAPFLELIETEYEKMEKALGISPDYVMHPDANPRGKKSELFAKVVADAGIQIRKFEK